MAAGILQELAQHPELLYRHTVEEYHRMIANGSVAEGEPYELLDGQIVRIIRHLTGENPMTISRRHGLAVVRLSKLSRKLETAGCHMQTQQPVAIPPNDEPEPDGAIIRGSEDDYPDHPLPKDVLCMIEVADASLRRDRGYKLQLYANAGIAVYVIVNLIDEVVELYRKPAVGDGKYADATILSLDEKLALPTASGAPLVVPVKQLYL